MNYELLITELGADHRALITKADQALKVLDGAAAAQATAQRNYDEAYTKVAEYAGLIKLLEASRDEETAASIDAARERKARAKDALGKIGDVK